MLLVCGSLMNQPVFSVYSHAHSFRSLSTCACAYMENTGWFTRLLVWHVYTCTCIVLNPSSLVPRLSSTHAIIVSGDLLYRCKGQRAIYTRKRESLGTRRLGLPEHVCMCRSFKVECCHECEVINCHPLPTYLYL